MKKILFVGSCLLALLLPSITSANLSLHGPYVGFQGGMAMPHDDSLSYRAYLGYRINDYLGIDVGYAKYSDKDSRNDVDTTDYDLMFKGVLPLLFGFNIFAEGGLGYVQQSINDDSNNGFQPELGAGLGLTVLKIVNVDVSWLHIFGSEKINDIDFAAIGLTITL